MAKVQIYGEIVPFQDEWVAENGLCNLSYVNKQLNDASGEDLEVCINSPGGNVDEGFAIYSALRRYAKDNKATITTRADGRVASIATIIFLAGDTRIASQYIDPFIHNAWMMPMPGDVEEIKKQVEDLDRATDRMAKFYSEHTNLTYEEARDIMKAETSITPEEALNIRFATEIEEVVRPAALQKKHSTIKNKSKKVITMSDKNEKGLIEHLKAFFKGEGPKALDVFTSTNETIVFPDLEEGATPSVGDKAEIDGKAAEGRITLQDGSTYVFVAGVLEEIVPAEDEDGDDDAMEALKAENAALKAKLDAQAKQVSAQAKEISAIKASQKEQEKQWNGLKNLVSAYKVDDKEEGDKNRKSDGDPQPKNRLAGAIKALKKKDE